MIFVDQKRTNIPLLHIKYRTTFLLAKRFGIFNFVRKLKTTKKNPEDPVNPVCPACPACPMESVFVFYSIGVEYEVHSSGVAPGNGTGV